MPKITAGYFIDEEIKTWLTEKAKLQQRSASWILNQLLIEIKEQDKNAVG
jgi:hypothetical protein